MKRNVTIVVLLMMLFQMNFASAMSVIVRTEINDLCGQNTGSVSAVITGGTAPYTYLWNTGSTVQVISGLVAGNYTVTVTDISGATASSSGLVESVPAPQFYASSVVLANPGQNNGSVSIVMYSGILLGALHQPSFTYIFNLYDGSNNIVQSDTENCTTGSCSTFYHDFNNLPAGFYTAECIIPGLSCTTTNSFELKTIPAISPSLSTLVSCNNSPTGKITINTHPASTLNRIFTSDLTSTLGLIGNNVTSKFKVSVYDGLNNKIQYQRTQDSIIHFEGLIPGNYTIKIYTGDTIDVLWYGIHDSLLVYTGNVTIGNDPSCSYVTGNVFADYDRNCSRDFSDKPLKETLIELSPGGYSSTSDENGDFYIPVPSGTYTLKQYAKYYYTQVCPDTNTFTIVNSAPGSVINVSLADSVNETPENQVGIIASQARPGFNLDYTITAKNLTANQSTIPTVTFNYDPLLTFVSSTETILSASAGQLIFSGITLGDFGTHDIVLRFNVPSATSIGTALRVIATIGTAAAETNLSNNADTLSQIVTGSFDPNEKSVSPQGAGTRGYISSDQLLKYTIHFQNTGNDTAFNVVVTDTLSPALDIHSIAVTNATHDYHYEFINGNIVKFYFDNILLPDSGADETKSHGAIKFSINQRAGNLPGTRIDNSANIYFDFNTPVITNSVRNTINDCSLSANPVILFNNGILTSSVADNNQWFLNNNVIPGATNSTYQVVVPGYYYVLVSDTTGCIDKSDSLFVNFTGIKKNSKSDILISPNPVNDLLTVSNFNFNAGDQIKIYDLNGKLNYSSNISRNSTELRLTDINFASGVYFLQILNGDEISHKKFVKL